MSTTEVRCANGRCPAHGLPIRPAPGHDGECLVCAGPCEAQVLAVAQEVHATHGELRSHCPDATVTGPVGGTGALPPPPLSPEDLDALLTLIGDAGMWAYGVDGAERLRAWVWHHAPEATREAWEKRGAPDSRPPSGEVPVREPWGPAR